MDEFFSTLRSLSARVDAQVSECETKAEEVQRRANRESIRARNDAKMGKR